tara:strand:+ start:1106 stop:2155 length:1050 start_codon:yes stop_codon:yes gene_type:complete
MNRTIIFILFFLCSIGHSQSKTNQLLDTWVNTKTEMKDGSKYISFYSQEKRYIEFTFNKDYYVLNSYPARLNQGEIQNYKLNIDRIIASPNFEFNIEKLTQDSLVISEQMVGLTDDKLKRYYLSRKSSLIKKAKKKNQNSINLLATQNFTPKYKGNLTLDLNNKLRNHKGTLEISGFLNLKPHERKAEVKVSKIESDSEIMTNYTIKILNKTYKKWNLKGFENYEMISIPFIIVVRNVGRSRGCKIKFFSQLLNDLNVDYGKPYENMTESSKYFGLGIASYESRDFESAITNFTKSYEWDHSFLDALYNRAASYYENEQLDSACSDWKKLKELGQINGELLYNTNCEIN